MSQKQNCWILHELTRLRLPTCSRVAPRFSHLETLKQSRMQNYFDFTQPKMPSSIAEEDDEELQRAIALSLEGVQSSPPAVKDETPVLNGKATNPASHTNTATDECQTTTTHEAVRVSNLEDTSAMNKPMGILGLNRKAMEQERLARLSAQKRDRPISPPPRKKIRLEEPSDTARRENIKHGNTKPVQAQRPKATIAPALRFARGSILKTFSPFHPSDERTIKIEELIDKENIRTAMLSSFLIDADWILGGKFDLKRTKFYMVLHAKSDADRAMYRQDFDGTKQARLCMPKLSGMIGTMHSKLMLLFFAGFLRIVVPTANLVDFDWGETGVMENSVFVIDLPRRKNEENVTPSELPPFAQSLLRFLEKQDLQVEAREGLLNFDFEATRRLAFVHSCAGSHFDGDVHYTGLAGLSAAVRQLGLDTKGDIQLDFAASSLGSLKDETVNTIYQACRGSDITSLASRERNKKVNEAVRQNMRIYFPTHDTVAASIGGTDNAGTVCLDANYWSNPGFPRAMLRDYCSTRQGLLSHNKILLVRGRRNDGTPFAWAYIGSANCSDSAWGKMVTKGVKMTCNNWECGVLVPVEDLPPEGGLDDLAATFRGVLDVPFEAGEGRGLEYGERRPWFYKSGDREGLK